MLVIYAEPIKSPEQKFTATGHAPTKGNSTLTSTKGGIDAGNDLLTPICRPYDTLADPLLMELMRQVRRRAVKQTRPNRSHHFRRFQLACLFTTKSSYEQGNWRGLKGKETALNPTLTGSILSELAPMPAAGALIECRCQDRSAAEPPL